jgi:hypothetical protein
LALHDHLVIVTKYQDPAFATALACQEPVIRVVCHDVGSDASWPSSRRRQHVRLLVASS